MIEVGPPDNYSKSHFRSLLKPPDMTHTGLDTTNLKDFLAWLLLKSMLTECLINTLR